MDGSTGRRVYAPPLDHPSYALDADAGEGKRRLLIAAIMGVVVLALGAVAWNFYGRSPPPLIRTDADFKTLAAAPNEDTGEMREVYRLMENKAAAPLTTSAPAAAAAPAQSAAPAASGRFAAQLAALRSEENARAAWGAMSSQAPELLRGLRMDIQRADLGSQGVLYRLRAGYFATREDASAFCEKAKAAGGACMVVMQ
ncbi:MAG: SPOR domain-containing protein [Hyphomonadaceae bacterium]